MDFNEAKTRTINDTKNFNRKIITSHFNCIVHCPPSRQVEFSKPGVFI